MTYEERYQNACAAIAYKSTQKTLRDSANIKERDKKIASRAQYLALPVGFVAYMLDTDPSFAYLFISSPKKASLAEKTAKTHLTNALGISITKLPNGKGGKVIAGGAILPSEEGASDTKTIDFTWENKGKDGKIHTAYAAHKRTEGQGGSQNSQAKDLHAFMKEARIYVEKHPNDNVHFFAIGDGDHYKDELEKWNKIDRIDRRVEACNSDQIKDLWNKILNGDGNDKPKI